MPNRVPKQDPDAIIARGRIPDPEPADYSDELSDAQIDELSRFAPQDEREMGPLVHEFRW